MDQAHLQRIVEALLLASSEPLSRPRLLEALASAGLPVEANALAVVLERIAADYRDRVLELKEVASGLRLQVRQDYAHWVGYLHEEKPPKYSRAILETLALIAYRQPITRGEIEEVRGVTVSSHIIKTLVERQWIKVIGHKDLPGRPALYATTRQFLDYFGLSSLDELPSLQALKPDVAATAELDLERDNVESVRH